MEHQTLYRCTGSCGGVSPEPKNCGSTTCEMSGQPLQAIKQCDACCAAAEKDGQTHACAMCDAA